MTIAYLAFQRSGHPPANSNKTWNHITDATTAVSLLNESGQAASWSWQYSAAPFAYVSGDNTLIGSGDAGWVDESTVAWNGHAGPSDGSWAASTITGLTPNEDYKLALYIHGDVTTRRIQFRFNGGTVNQIPARAQNYTEVDEFIVTADANGEILFEFSKISGSDQAYLKAGYIQYPAVGPLVSLDNNPQLGATLSFTYANYAGIPVGPLAFDQGARSLPDEAVTITDNGDGSGSGVTDTALPGLPANGESVTPFPLIGENITITLPDPGV